MEFSVKFLNSPIAVSSWRRTIRGSMDRQNEGKLSRGTRQDSPSDVNDAGENNYANCTAIGV